MSQTLIIFPKMRITILFGLVSNNSTLFKCPYHSICFLLFSLVLKNTKIGAEYHCVTQILTLSNLNTFLFKLSNNTLNSFKLNTKVINYLDWVIVTLVLFFWLCFHALIAIISTCIPSNFLTSIPPRKCKYNLLLIWILPYLHPIPLIKGDNTWEFGPPITDTTHSWKPFHAMTAPTTAPRPHFVSLVNFRCFFFFPGVLNVLFLSALSLGATPIQLLSILPNCFWNWERSTSSHSLDKFWAGTVDITVHILSC